MNRMLNVCFLLLFCGTIMAVDPFLAHSDPLDPYIQAAKKEGSVTIGVSLRSKVHGKPAGELYIAAFQKHHPFLKANFNRIGGGIDRERILTEMTAGIFNFDVVTVSDTMIPTIVEAKLPRVVEWGKLGVPEFLIHPDNIGLTLRTPVFGIAYNRDLVPDEVAQTFTWETCTDPKWKGKTSANDRPRHLEPLYQERVWGRKKTLDYAKRWAENKPVIEYNRSVASNKLTAGAFPMICGIFRSHVEELRNYAGAKNIGIVFPEPVPVGVGDLIYIPDKAKHPNAGILFLVWSSSKEGQNHLDEVNFSGHPSIEGSKVNDILKGKKLAFTTWEDVSHTDQDLTEILKTMGIPVVRGKAKKKK
ncbi:MAG: extracellular solute-binding protein [Desulfobacterales bacterium]|nr:extracellular solute-binding protein [Desulfobacterales bacterium]